MRYTCEVCDRSYDQENKAINCEKTHTIIKLDKWYLIPIFGFILSTYKLFSVKNGIIKPKNFKERLLLDWVVVSPVLTILAFFTICWYIGIK